MVLRLEHQFTRAKNNNRPSDLDELPDELILSQLTSLMRDHAGFIMGYDEAIALMERAAELRRLEKSSQSLANQAKAVLQPMLDASGLLASGATRLVSMLNRALDQADESTTALVGASVITATKSIVSFGRAIMPKLLVFTLVAGTPLDAYMKLSGDPNWETLRVAMSYLVENKTVLTSFAGHDAVFSRWLEWLILRIQQVLDEEAMRK